MNVDITEARRQAHEYAVKQLKDAYGIDCITAMTKPSPEYFFYVSTYERKLYWLMFLSKGGEP